AQDAARDLQVCQQGIEHRVQSFACNSRLEKRNVQEMFDAAMAVEREACAGDGIESGSGNIFDTLPSGVTAFEGRLSDAPVGMIHERASLGHRQPLTPSVQKNHVEI